MQHAQDRQEHINRGRICASMCKKNRALALCLYTRNHHQLISSSHLVDDLSIVFVLPFFGPWLKMLILYAIIYGSFITYIHAQQNPTTFFIEPPAASQAQLYFDNKAYVVGDTLNVKWVTDQEDYTVCLWQQNAQTVVASVSLQCIYSK